MQETKKVVRSAAVAAGVYRRQAEEYRSTTERLGLVRLPSTDPAKCMQYANEKTSAYAESRASAIEKGEESEVEIEVVSPWWIDPADTVRVYEAAMEEFCGKLYVRPGP